MKKYAWATGYHSSDYAKPLIGNLIESFHRANAQLDALKADKTLTRQQRSPAVERLLNALDKAVQRQATNLRATLEDRVLGVQKRMDADLSAMSMVDAIALAGVLKGMTASERLDAMRAAPEFALAALKAPVSLSNVEQDGLKELYLEHHRPDDFAVVSTAITDLAALDGALAHITSEATLARGLEIDREAMKGRYVENLDSIDVGPRPNETMAQYQARIGLDPQGGCKFDPPEPSYIKATMQAE